MTSVQDYRNYVRTYFDADTEELPDLLIDPWIRQGVATVARRINDWSFYQSEDVVTVQPNVGSYVLPTVTQIARVVGSRGPLARVDQGEAEARYEGITPVTGPIEAYSTWNGKLYLWPSPKTAETYTVRGYRVAVNVLAGGAAAEPDLPADFHDVVLDFVMAQAHLFQEDPDLAAARMQSFQSGVDELLKSDAEAPLDSPIVVNGGLRTPGVLSRPRLPWE